MKIDDRSRKKIVFWSGGLDSTTVLLQLLNQSSTQHPVHTISLTQHPQIHGIQLKAEAQTRARFAKWAESRYPGCLYQTTIEVTSPQMCLEANRQATIWLGTLLPYIGGGNEGIALYLGYCRGDDFWHSRSHYERAAREIATISETSIKLFYPLEWSDKSDIVSALNQAKVPANCYWTCENPVPSSDTKFKPCGRCLKCKSLDGALTEVQNQKTMLSYKKSR